MRIRLANHGTKWKIVKPGYFVRKIWWFGDVWAEVLSISDWSPEYKSITYAWQDSRHGTDSVYESLRGSWTRYFQVVDVCSPVEMRKKIKKGEVSILHLKDKAYGYSQRQIDRKDNPERYSTGLPTT
jgi:hypothetical protein